MSYQSGWPKGIMVDKLQISIHQDDSKEIKLDTNESFNFDEMDQDRHRMVILSSNHSVEELNSFVNDKDNKGLLSKGHTKAYTLSLGAARTSDHGLCCEIVADSEHLSIFQLWMEMACCDLLSLSIYSTARPSSIYCHLIFVSSKKLTCQSGTS